MGLPGEKPDVTSSHDIARVFTLYMWKELDKKEDIEVMPLVPGQYLLAVPNGKWSAACYPNVRVEVPYCGPCVLKADNVFHCSTTLKDDFLADNDWHRMKHCYIYPMARSILENIEEMLGKCYLWFVQLKGENGIDGKSWFTGTNGDFSCRVTQQYKVGSGMQLQVEVCCANVSRGE